jgi:hypothetical protein
MTKYKHSKVNLRSYKNSGNRTSHYLKVRTPLWVSLEILTGVADDGGLMKSLHRFLIA